MNKEQSRIPDKNQPKSALKNEMKKGNQIKRFDRKGQEIKYGSKYEITINDKAQFFALPDNDNEIAYLDSSNSSKYENTEICTKTNFKTQISLELNSKEQAFLKMLSYNFEQNKKKGKRKECCIIQ